MIHRDVGRPLLEVTHWIAASAHDFVNQLVGNSNCLLRIIDKAALHFVPFGTVGCSIRRRQRANRKPFAALLAKFKNSFRLTNSTRLRNDAVILRTEAGAQPLATAHAHDKECEHCDNNEADYEDSYHDSMIHAASVIARPKSDAGGETGVCTKAQNAIASSDANRSDRNPSPVRRSPCGSIDTAAMHSL